MTSQAKTPKRKKRRKSGYTPALGRAICKLLAEGFTLRQVCKRLNCVSERTVRQWALDTEHPFSPQYTRARELGYQRMADQIVEIADESSNDWIETKHGPMFNKEAAMRSQIRIDTRKWLLSKALPKIYGDKLDVNAKHEAGDSFKQLWSALSSGQVHV